MRYYSQKDKRYASNKLPKSSLTMENYGCYVTSIAMLGQVDPVSLLKSSNFANGGLLISSKAAKSAGLEYVGASKKPIGWCIGVTDHYAPKWPTHFFVVNEDLQLQIDPLDIDPKPEPLTYDIFEYRIFKGVKLHNALQEAIHLTSKSWQMLEEVQSQLHKSNTLLRNLS